ncbi:hypothetical protein GCM10010274_57950 [Streptomyces lavendofoliae]|uniref:Uncharacterized protein n=1 Tax=Streptomyces lavendofoliae TaxID=67314 RepID=A0A918I2D9_9ACTN|nr:hypothetical protein GCM10010274_57950 [Streptomyces lavendofoliae]
MIVEAHVAPIGSTDEGRVRHLTVAQAAPLRRSPLRTQEACASNQQLQQIVAEGLKEMCFQDGGRRAGSLEEVRFTDL